MKTQVWLRDTVGKTLERICLDDVIVFLWTDGTFSVGRMNRDGLDDKFEDMVISMEPHPDWHSAQLWWPAKLVELGIASDSEIKEAQERAEKATAAAQAKRDREQFEFLKRKLEV